MSEVIVRPDNSQIIGCVMAEDLILTGATNFHSNRWGTGNLKPPTCSPSHHT